MSPADPQTPADSSPPLSLRRELPGDESFLFQVYAGTREEELALTNWDENTRRQFLNLQFAAMRRGYANQYPDAEFLIVSLGQERVGRLVINRSADAIRVVDVALLPAHRNRGFGTILMRQVCAEATRAGQPVRLCVLQGNRALRWYERLGFTFCESRGIYDELEWRAPAPQA